MKPEDGCEGLCESRLLPVAERVAARWETLWINGDPRALAPPLIAVVGTREPDHDAMHVAERIAEGVARAGHTVLSGGALGIDAAAHRGALLGEGRTVVVLPSGLGHLYPLRHGSLYRAVIAAGGALVSQFRPETPPSRWTFPRRNELVAALADVLVVVQAPAQSGSLHAARLAMKLGRRVLAVPASLAERRGRGCVALLREGALPCTGADDVLAALEARDGALFSGQRGVVSQTASPKFQTRAHATPRARARTSRAHTCTRDEAQKPETGRELQVVLDGDEAVVYHCLDVPRHVDELVNASGLVASRLQTALLTLVLGGCIEDRGGGMYARSRG